MKIGLKARLVLAFLSIIILPAVITSGLFFIVSSQIEQIQEEQEQQLNQLFIDVKSDVENHYKFNEDPEIFYQKIKPLLKKYKIQIVIFTKDDKVLFRSHPFSTGDHAYSKLPLTNLDFKADIDGEIIKVEVQPISVDIEPFNTLYKVIINVFISSGIGLIVLISLIIGWTWYISRTILVPLKRIYTATEEMRNGNLEYPIEYNKNDEIGRFINGFNLMRTHLKESVEKQKQEERARKELIASISHDLRTPLSSIKGYVEGLQDGIAQDEKMQKKYLNIIQTKTDQLDHLIEDLFNFSKLDLNELSMEKELVNSKEYFTEILHEEEEGLKQKQVELKLINTVPAVCLQIDPQRLKQVFANLLDNAVRYGGNLIQVSIVEQRDKGKLFISVSDNGIGIEEKDLSFIFNRFYRTEKSRSREYGGTGLGLSIAQSIVQAHDGKISVKSQQGVGTEFIIDLPLYVTNKHT